jgi:hypothetical protein
MQQYSATMEHWSCLTVQTYNTMWMKSSHHDLSWQLLEALSESKTILEHQIQSQRGWEWSQFHCELVSLIVINLKLSPQQLTTFSPTKTDYFARRASLSDLTTSSYQKQLRTAAMASVDHHIFASNGRFYGKRGIPMCLAMMQRQERSRRNAKWHAGYQQFMTRGITWNQALKHSCTETFNSFGTTSLGDPKLDTDPRTSVCYQSPSNQGKGNSECQVHSIEIRTRMKHPPGAFLH